MEKKTVPVELPEGYVEFYKKIETWENEQLFRLKKADHQGQENRNQALKEEQRPLIDIEGFELDTDAYRNAALAFLQMIAGERENISEKQDEYRVLLEKIDYDRAAEAVLAFDRGFFDEIAEEGRLDADMTAFILDHAMRPFLRSYAARYQEAIRADEDLAWGRGMCPVCGAQAMFSTVKPGNGQRYLFCEHCYTEWIHKYLGCIHCGNGEPDSLHYFILNDDDAHQIFVCDKCKGYLKTFDERKGAIASGLYIIGVETIYLDMIAEEQGYSNAPALEQDLN